MSLCTRQAIERTEWAEAYEDDDLVFAQENGAPLRPDWVLDRFHNLTEQARLPRGAGARPPAPSRHAQ